MGERRVISVNGSETVAHAPVRPLADHSFDILGRPTADVIDIGALFAEASVRMGDSVWVGYVPVRGRITCRVRVSNRPVHSGGDAARMALVFDEQLLGPRLRSRALAPGGCLVVDAGLPDSARRHDVAQASLCVHRVPLREWAAEIPGFAGGERLVALGMLAWMYARDPDVIRRLLENRLAARGRRIISAALRLFESGWREAPGWVSCRYELHSSVKVATPSHRDVLDGRAALVIGALQGNLSRCLPAPSHPLAEGFVRVYEARGGQVALPSLLADAGGPFERDAATGPWLAVQVAGGETDSGGMSSEVSGVAAGPRVMLRIERVLSEYGPLFPSWINPLTGPSDLLGEQHPLVLAPTTVDQCLQFMSLAGRIAAHYRRDVTVLVDALLLGAVQQWSGPAVPRGTGVKTAPDVVGLPALAPDALAGDGMPFDPEVAPATPSAFLDGRPAAHAAVSALLRQLGVPGAGAEAFGRPAAVVGGDDGDVLLVGWGATRGPVEEAVRRLRARGAAVSSVHLTTLTPLPPDLGVLLARFKRVIAIDVLTESYDAQRRVRHLHSLLRGARYRAVVENPSLQRLAAGVQLGMHLFPHPLPLTPGSIERFVLQNGAVFVHK